MKTDPPLPPTSSASIAPVGAPAGFFVDFLHTRTELQLELCLTTRPQLAADHPESARINQPLTAIAHYAHACERLLALPDPDLKEVRRALREIGSQVMRASALRSVDSASIEAEPAWISVNEVIREMAALIRLETRRHDVDFRLALDDGLPDLAVPAALIREMVLTLVRKALSNAFAAPGRRILTLRTSQTIDRGVSVRVILHDVVI
jgi:C4-dicarboxylate-specific signal transduction histidine kinase